ncbi:MAG TPA: hypothetical protein VGD37_07275, partial [Kofleriaceae bacterium]
MFHVYVDGVTSSSPDAVRELANAMATRYGIPEAELHARLSRGRFRVKADVDRATAEVYVRDLEAIGARVRIEPAGATSEPAAGTARTAMRSSLPPQPGSRPATSSLPPQPGSRPATTSLPPQPGSRPATTLLPPQPGSRPAMSSLPPQPGSRPATTSLPPQPGSRPATSSLPPQPGSRPATSSLPPAMSRPEDSA